MADNEKMTDEFQQNASEAAHATAKATAQLVKGAAKTGSSAAHAAIGAATGGAGALVMALWDFKDVIPKIFVTFLLITVIIIAPVAALPRLITNKLFGLDDTEKENKPTQSLSEIYSEYMDEVNSIISEAHQDALDSVNSEIESASGINVELSKQNINDLGATSANYDVSYVLACYSISMENGSGVSFDDFVSKLKNKKSSMFTTSYTTQTTTEIVPVTYTTYTTRQVFGLEHEPVSTNIYLDGSNTPTKVYTGSTASYWFTIYVPSGTASSTVPVTEPAYQQTTYYTVNKDSSGRIVSTQAHTEGYQKTSSTVTYTPTEQTVSYRVYTISSFNQDALEQAFDIDRNALYADSETLTVGQAIDDMASYLRQTMYLTNGSYTAGSTVALTDQELINYIAALDCNDTRKYILRTACSLVGKVSYFWGGKSPTRGWNEEWGTAKTVTSAGSTTTGTTRPYGLDCSGFMQWVFINAYGIDITAGSSTQYANCTKLTESELQPGDLVFYVNDSGSIYHVAMFAGWQDGNMQIVHCSGSGVQFSSRSTTNKLYGRPSNVDYNAAVPSTASANVSSEVESYTALIEKYAAQYGMSDYVALIKAVMMQESGGRLADVMQCSACGYNTRGGAITDPEYSIQVGIQYLRDCLNLAGVTSPTDTGHISLGLQGYNYGSGYITWAQKNYGGYSLENAQIFSDNKKAQYGYRIYGDPQYVPHVLRYYQI